MDADAVRLLSGVAIVDAASLARAIQALHRLYGVPHVVVTSVRLPAGRLCVAGSSAGSDGAARPFRILFPAIDCYFCGTGDMFGALVAVRMRDAAAAVPGLRRRPGWLSDDAVPGPDLPLARAAERVLASMHEVLSRTRDAMPAAARPDVDAHDVQTRAAELQLVQNLDCLRAPTARFKAEAM